MVDHRLPDGKCGPLNAEADFNSHIVHKDISLRTREVASLAHSRQHRVFFTHADFHPLNILIDQGRLSGIVDWECAGFFPEYWEYTKAIYGARSKKEMEKLWRLAFDEDYETELRAEQLLVSETP